jgi:hypothetical protein
MSLTRSLHNVITVKYEEYIKWLLKKPNLRNTFYFFITTISIAEIIK